MPSATSRLPCTGTVVRDSGKGWHQATTVTEGSRGNAELLDEAGERLPEVLPCSFLGVALAVRTQARPQLRVGTPQAIVVELHDDRHGYRARFGRVTPGSDSAQRLTPYPAVRFESAGMPAWTR